MHYMELYELFEDHLFYFQRVKSLLTEDTYVPAEEIAAAFIKFREIHNVVREYVNAFHDSLYADSLFSIEVGADDACDEHDNGIIADNLEQLPNENLSCEQELEVGADDACDEVDNGITDDNLEHLSNESFPCDQELEMTNTRDVPMPAKDYEEQLAKTFACEVVISVRHHTSILVTDFSIPSNLGYSVWMTIKQLNTAFPGACPIVFSDNINLSHLYLNMGNINFIYVTDFVSVERAIMDVRGRTVLMILSARRDVVDKVADIWTQFRRQMCTDLSVLVFSCTASEIDLDMAVELFTEKVGDEERDFYVYGIPRSDVIRMLGSD